MSPQPLDDEFERRLRDVLHSNRLSIEPDAEALERIHAGARRRQQHRVLASGVAALAVIAVVATGVALRPVGHPTRVAGASSTSPGTTLGRSASPSRSTALGTANQTSSAPSSPSSQSSLPSSNPAAVVPTAATIPAGGAPPKDFVPMSVTAVNASTYWVLGHAACAGSICTALAKTTDGGATFTEVGAPPSAVVPDAPGSNDVYGATTISDVRFVDARTGWAFGGGLWQTSDGGQHWTPAPIPGSVERLAVASGRAWAIVFTGATAGNGPTYELYSATYPNGHWAKIDSAGTFGPAEPALAVQDTRVFVTGTDSSGGQRTVAATSASSFTTIGSPPCEAGAGDAVSSSAQGLWLACSASAPLHGVYFSPDFGASWQVGSATFSAASVAVGAVDAKSAIIGGRGSLVRIGSDGSTGKVSQPSVPSSTTWSFIGFTDSSNGFAVPILNGSRQLWRTTDGGQRWSVVKF